MYVDEPGTTEMCLNLDVFHVFPRMGVVQGVSRSRDTLISERLKTLESDLGLAAKIRLAFGLVVGFTVTLVN